jgi:hypothetical protein
MESSNSKSAVARLLVDAARPVTVKLVPVLVSICVAGAVPGRELTRTGRVRLHCHARVLRNRSRPQRLVISP